MSKVDAFFDSIRTDNTKTLHWSLRYGGFSPIKPFEEDTQLPPIHLAVEVRKLKSLKCMLETMDRMRDVSGTVDYPMLGTGMTPLMAAAANGWKDGCFELIRNDASLTAKCQQGKTAIDYAKLNKRKAVIQLFEDFLKEDEEVVETQAMKLQREAKEHHQAEKAKEEKAREQANLAAKDAAFDEKDRVEDAQKAASSLAKWDEVKSALDTLSTEVKIAREDKDAAAPDAGAIDPTLWSCETLKILRLRLPKGALTSLPADLGRLANLTELIVSHNSLTTLPAEVGLLVNLKALEAEANCLDALPAELEKCTKLEVLNVTGNALTSLSMLGAMVEMKSLLASNNQLTKLDFTIEVMVHLRVLSVSGNQLTELPDGVGQLVQMTNFIASDNQLADLPFGMHTLTEKKLVELQLTNNKFTDRKIKQLIEKSPKLVKELTNFLEKRGAAGGGGGGGGKKKKKKK